jgi:hypothetical protein
MPVFELNLADLMNFKRMQRRAPKLFGRAAGHALNSAAFGTRKLAIRNIKAQMIARNEKFIEGSVRVNKARLGAPLSQQSSEVGSIKRERFSGWLEQEGGQQTKRKHYGTEDSRKGDIKKQIARPYKLRKVAWRPHPKFFRGNTPQDRARKMLHTISRAGFTKPFVIVGLENTQSRTPPGLYRFAGGRHPKRRIELLQRFKAPKPTERKPWMAPAREEYVRRVNLRTVWGRAVERELRKVGYR